MSAGDFMRLAGFLALEPQAPQPWHGPVEEQIITEYVAIGEVAQMWELANGEVWCELRHGPNRHYGLRRRVKTE